jgi:hypothetical protein
VALVPWLSAPLFLATIVTIVLAPASYAAFRLRNRRRPHAETLKPVYFRRGDLDARHRPQARP